MKKVMIKVKGFIIGGLRLLAKGTMAIVLVVMMAVAAFSVSPVYDFVEARPFSGPDIYNPYEKLDTLNCWKKANFHTHTRVEGILNECSYWPDEVLEVYDSLGYDIVTFSNHNELTAHPKGELFQSDAYEHGYNLLKFHKLVYGASEVWHFDNILPVFASQKQFQILQLAATADLLQINHPLRTPTLQGSQFESLSGYKLIELDSGKSTENDYWDRALSAGRYCFGVANDDLHHPDLSHKIARRCNFLCTPSARYDDVLANLNSGCFYSMRIPDYGKGNWKVKRDRNMSLPSVKTISLTDDVVYVQFSQSANLIKMIGQDHTELMALENSDRAEYMIKPTDPYVRIVAYFPDGEVIYTNPFARYDARTQSSPFDVELPQMHLFLTILFNLLLFVVCVACGYVLYRYIIRK